MQRVVVALRAIQQQRDAVLRILRMVLQIVVVTSEVRRRAEVLYLTHRVHHRTEVRCQTHRQVRREVTHHRTSVLQVLRRVAHRVRQVLHRTSALRVAHHRVARQPHDAKSDV